MIGRASQCSTGLDQTGTISFNFYKFSFEFSKYPAPEGDVVPLVCRAGVGVGTFTNPRLDRGLPVWQGGDSDPLGKYLSFDF